MDKEIMKGSIDILLLSLVSKNDMYGYEITKALKEQSQGTYEMSEGTLYPALKRLEKKEWLNSYWYETEKGRRKYYRITDKGRIELERKLDNWNKVGNLISKCREGLV
ncbi:PadR family transcriptional regulator [Evansella tamaricis]|uniref:PadR family transcriptional regulator n=1 Tax=Evansella tamaricis TaxID=2069301 RepID=A0ABS6JIM2_9BACI|nr:helix-turn-helix transcriptional regulator [Evansella tamaricis]MBU9712178.1 PadR family transcriptional regulator [Evansella tamaricis]